MNTRNLFAYVLSAVVVAVTIVAIMAIWGLISWEFINHYLWKTIQSLIVVVIGTVVIYIVQAMLGKNDTPNRGGTNSI
jgi:hypothetical protein